MATVLSYCDVITMRMRACLIELVVALVLAMALAADYGESPRSKSSFAEVVRAVNAAHRTNSFRTKYLKNYVQTPPDDGQVDLPHPHPHPHPQPLIVSHDHSHNNVLGDESQSASEKTGANVSRK